MDVGNTLGDRRYSKWTLGLGDEVYLFGHVQALEDATTPLHPEDVVVTPADDEPLFSSYLSENEIVRRIGTEYRLKLAGGAVAIVSGAGLIVVGMTLF